MAPTKVYITHQLDYGSSHETNPGEHRYENYVTQQAEYTLGAAFLEKPKNPHHECFTVELPKKAPPRLACVVVRYADGGTFGCTEGYGEIAGVFTEYDAATKLAEALKDDPKAPGVMFVDGGYQWRPWDGYFARILSVRVEFVALTPAAKKEKKK